MSLRIEMLPAAQGDALWIEWGSPTRRLLFDAGTPATAQVVLQRIAQLDRAERRFELLVVSHIDSDHIGGTIPLLEDSELGTSFNDIWFNGLRHLPAPVQPLGPGQGDKLTKLLLGGRHPWNLAWGGGPVVVADGRDVPLPRVDLDGGLRITLLSPYADQLATLRPEWMKLVKDHGLVEGYPRVAAPELPPTGEVQALGPRVPPVPATARDVVDIAGVATRDFKQDVAKPNGTSIAVLLEYDERAVMLTADAYPEVLRKSVDRLLKTPDERLRLDAFKVPHHGSRANLDIALMRRIDCRRHLISTDGTSTAHPHVEAVARLLDSAPGEHELVFNYRSEWNAVWDDDAVVARSGYVRSFPPKDGPPGIVVEIA